MAFCLPKAIYYVIIYALLRNKILNKIQSKARRFFLAKGKNEG